MNPGATEVCNGDDNCDGDVGESCTADLDGDGFDIGASSSDTLVIRYTCTGT